LALLSFQPLFTEGLRRDQLFASPPPFLVHLQCPALSAACSFLVLCCSGCFVCLFVCRAGGQSVQGAMLVYLRGGCGNTTWCLGLNCWSSRCLPSRFGASVWQHRSALVFSV
jgi:hypothetical protein